MPTLDLHAVARLPRVGDNVAIAVRELDAGTSIRLPDGVREISHAVPEGHRFAVEHIAVGAELTSWGLPFGVAMQPIAPAEYVANERMLEVLAERGRPPASFPTVANFANRIVPYAHATQADFATVAPPTSVGEVAATFQGFDRGRRGVGTRNYIAVLGLTSRVAGFARAVAAAATATGPAAAGTATGGAAAPQTSSTLDGIVPIAHTEGAGRARPNNRTFLLRTLAGIATHPNVAAVLVADDDRGTINSGDLQAEIQASGRPTEQLLVEWFRVGPDLEAEVARAAAVIEGWRAQIGGVPRSEQPVARLNIALQCGGSDAFSGVSGNPLAGAGAREIVQRGGAAILAETDELIGAEPYIMSRVKDRVVGQRFLDFVEKYKQFAARHGSSAEHNPSGGNFFRGLYNITLKSLGAAMKLDPQLHVESVLDYAEPNTGPGFHFMNSPGNDLESVAGQVAGGANVIYFVTGNGSITNFPIVPTIKIVTTSGRFQLLEAEMDVNAGAYLDGVPMDQLTAELVQRTVDTASGEPSAGERAGHSQVQLWRDWRLDEAGTETSEATSAAAALRPGSSRSAEDLDGEPLAGAPHLAAPRAEHGVPAPLQFDALGSDGRMHTDQVALIMPTSLCAGQVARLAAAELNRRLAAQPAGSGGTDVTRYVALPHTEGCGCSSGASLRLFDRTLLGYVTHPIVATAVLLEHGCEHTHNDHFRAFLTDNGVDADRFGWASVQLDGGIAEVSDRIGKWLSTATQALQIAPAPGQSLLGVSFGLVSDGELPTHVAGSLAVLAGLLLDAGASVVLTDQIAAQLAAGLVQATRQLQQQQQQRPAAGVAVAAPGPEQLRRPTLAYGQRATRAGLHVMETASQNIGESLTGLGATGAEVLLAAVPYPIQGHPMLPVIQATWLPEASSGCDMLLAATPDAPGQAIAGELLMLLLKTASRGYLPQASRIDNVDFQVPRGATGVSM
jgi:altronate dehydratase